MVPPALNGGRQGWGRDTAGGRKPHLEADSLRKAERRKGSNCPHEGEEKSSSAGMDGELSRKGPEGSWGGGRGRTWSPPHAGRRARRRLSEAQRPELRTHPGGL